MLHFQKGELVKPNYNSVDLAEVELAASAAQMVYYSFCNQIYSYFIRYTYNLGSMCKNVAFTYIYF